MRKRKKETKPRIRNNSDFVKRVQELVGNEYTFLEPYINSSTKIQVRHNVCNNVYRVRPNNFLNGERCSNPICKNKRISQSETMKNDRFLESVQKAVGDSYIFLEDYKKARDKLAFYHVDCGKVHYISPNNFKTGQRCTECSKIAKKMNNAKNAKKLFLAKIKGKYKLVSPFVDRYTPVTLIHFKCKQKWTTIPQRVLKGDRCYHCYGNSLKTLSKFKQEVYDLVGDEYTVIGDYKNTETKINIIHNKCGYRDWWVTPSNFLRGQRCPRCQESHGERMIRKILNNLDIKYIAQKRFSDCKYKNPLPFDFYLPCYNLCIEYDGEQHFKDIKYFSTDGGLKCRKIRDNIKNKYCKDNGISLLRISYKVTDIGDIQNLILNKINNIA